MDIPAIERDRAIRSYVPGHGIPTLLADPKTRKIYLNPLKRWVKPFTLTTEPRTITLAGNGATQTPVPMVIDNKGHFEIMGAYFKTSQPEGFTVKIADDTRTPILTNREIHVASIAAGEGAATKFALYGPDGSAGRMYRWPDSHWLKVDEKARSLHCIFRNLSANSNTIRFALHGLRWYHALAPESLAKEMNLLYEQRRRISPFFYSTEQFVQLAAGASDDFDVRFTDGPYTEWLKSTAFSDGSFRVQIREKATGKLLMNGMLPDDLVFGDGEFPFGLWESALFEPNYKLTLTLENTSGATNTIWVSLGCRHLWLP